MELYVLTLPLSPKENALFQHKGEEILFVLEGAMKFFHREKEFIVEEWKKGIASASMAVSLITVFAQGTNK